ncbi:MAG: hybrid sensor histidine kinase/response regulator, partial [Synechococcaceae cyanobacterium ELA182]
MTPSSSNDDQGLPAIWDWQPAVASHLQRPVGLLRLEGPDTLRFLHGQTSQDLQLARPGQWLGTCCISPTARLRALAEVLVVEGGAWLVISEGDATAVRQAFDRVLFPADDVRLSALSEVISGVAHELNNPLTAILGYAQIFNSLDGAERDHAVTTIEHEAQRAARIVRNLLSFARQPPPTTSRVDVEEIVRRVVEVMRYSLEVDNIRVELRLSGIPEIEADRAQLEQVFLNLVNNAQQALQPGGGEIVISTTHVSDFVRVSVADDGPGVPEEMRDRVFQPFFTTRDVGLGQGMGLSTAYGLVTQHGGRVWVEPSTSGGANFIVELPMHIADRAPEEASPMVPSGGGGERILVVDDELPIRALTSEILNHAGYRVTTAASGDEALRRLETVMFDLVVADMRMPGMDGAELYEHICDRWPSMERRVLFVTGDIDGARTSRR